MSKGPYRSHRYEVVLSYAGDDKADTLVKLSNVPEKARNMAFLYAPFGRDGACGAQI